MSATSAPYGFIPAKHTSGRGEPSVRTIAAAYGTKISKFQPVKLVTGGGIEAAAANEDILGVFAGVEYIQADGRPVVTTEWPTSGVSGATGIKAYVWETPGTQFTVQCDGSLAATSVGDQADISNATANGAGMSQATLSSTLKGAGNQGQFRIVELDGSQDNAWGDTYTKVIVEIARQQFIANKVAI